MSLPIFTPEGFLPEGIHAASLRETLERFGSGSEARDRQAELLRQIVESAKPYETIKRLLIWGSFVTTKREPNDLDYSIVVSVFHRETPIAPEHARFFIPVAARMYYGVDRNYLVIPDYPLEEYVERMDLLCHRRERRLGCGIVEIGLYREALGELP